MLREGKPIETEGIGNFDASFIGTVTVSVGGTFYAMDINSGKVFPLNVQGFDLSLYS